jgi:hypothetical protein
MKAVLKRCELLEENGEDRHQNLAQKREVPMILRGINQRFAAFSFMGA